MNHLSFPSVHGGVDTTPELSLDHIRLDNIVSLDKMYYIFHLQVLAVRELGSYTCILTR